MSALVPGLGGGERDWRGGGRGGSTSASELSDIEAVLETATAALEEIRNQVSVFAAVAAVVCSFSFWRSAWRPGVRLIILSRLHQDYCNLKG